MTGKRIFKLRFNCIGFQDVVVKAENGKAARELAERMVERCSLGDVEFCEFLPVEKGENVQYET